MTEELPEKTHEIHEDSFVAYSRAKARRDEAQAEMDSLRDYIVGDVPIDTRILTVNGAPVMRFTHVESSRLDTKRLRSDYPDIAAMYSKPSTSSRLELIK